MNDKLNPELFPAAAELVHPGRKWVITATAHPNFARANNGWGEGFHPLNVAADREKLMLALMKADGGVPSGWSFHRTGGVYAAYRSYMGDHERVEDESFPLLLLKCVSAMKGIEVYI